MAPLDPSNPSQRPSIFSRPEEDEGLANQHHSPRVDWHDNETRAHDALRPADARAMASSAPTGSAARQRGRPEEREGISRQVIVLGSMGLGILALSGFIAASLLGSDEEPAVAVLPTTSATVRPSDSPEPTPPPQTASPSPTPDPTPEPTPAGPPTEVVVGGWATITVGELQVRRAAGQDAESVYRLVRGAIVNVAEGPTVVAGGNWYRVASLGGATGWVASGWEANPYLATIAADPRLSECGQVRRAVFDVATGSVQPNDPLRIGDFALPAAGFQDASLGAIELLRGTGQEVCFTARPGSNGLPEMSVDLSVYACGSAVAQGGTYRLEPTDDDRVSLASQVIDPTIVHPALLDGGPADNRMSSNIRTIVSMMANEGTSGCLSISVTQRAGAIDAHRSVSVSQCSIVELYDADSLKLSPTSGGPTAWIKLAASNYQPGLFPLDRPVFVSVDASASARDRWAGAWPDLSAACG
jgi:hypothetical protein